MIASTAIVEGDGWHVPFAPRLSGGGQEDDATDYCWSRSPASAKLLGNYDLAMTLRGPGGRGAAPAAQNADGGSKHV